MTPGFIDFLKDQLSGFGPVSVRAMFGGAGLYREGTMFALVDDEIMYLKADELTRPEFEAEGLRPFEYSTKNGTNTLTSYWRAPERCLDDPEIMAEWARKAWGAALRGRKPKRPSSRSFSIARDLLGASSIRLTVPRRTRR